MSAIASATFDKLEKLGAGLLTFGFGVADLWHFHSPIGTNGDLIFVVGGLGALGVSLAYNAGVTAATSASVSVKSPQSPSPNP